MVLLVQVDLMVQQVLEDQLDLCFQSILDVLVDQLDPHFLSDLKLLLSQEFQGGQEDH